LCLIKMEDKSVRDWLGAELLCLKRAVHNN
jgi:hypothetical protein